MDVIEEDSSSFPSINFKKIELRKLQEFSDKVSDESDPLETYENGDVEPTQNDEGINSDGTSTVFVSADNEYSDKVDNTEGTQENKDPFFDENADSIADEVEKDRGKGSEAIIPDEEELIIKEEVLTEPSSSSKEIKKSNKTQLKFKVRDINTMYEADAKPATELKRKCYYCARFIADTTGLSWETMEFCGESCLSEYQKVNGSYCVNCTKKVSSLCMGKYCVRFGKDLRQFCSIACLEGFKKALKLCSFCQTDLKKAKISTYRDGKRRMFCSYTCRDASLGRCGKAKPKPGVKCTVCKSKDKELKFSYWNDKNLHMHSFCEMSCFRHFQFVNNRKVDECYQCRMYFRADLLSENGIIFDGQPCFFCSDVCKNLYIMRNRKIVYCGRCNVKKYNFDMIRKRIPNTNDYIQVCSINCLAMQQAAVNSKTSSPCGYCKKTAELKFHVTHTDGTILSVCTYACAVAHKNHQAEVAKSTSTPTRQTRGQKKNPVSSPIVPRLPVISSVVSLAPKIIEVRGNVVPTVQEPLKIPIQATRTYTRTQRSAAKQTPPKIQTAPAQSTTSEPENVSQKPPSPTKNFLVWKNPDPLSLRNVCTMVKPILNEQGTNIKPKMVDVAVQADMPNNEPPFITLPIPIYIPQVIPQIKLNFPKPIPMVIPVPVPIFIPTTKGLMNNLIKDMKKVKITAAPSDPFEADLLMMAELIAAEQKEKENAAAEGENNDNDAASVHPEEVATSANNSYGEDMIQMALNMAGGYSEPAVDLEGALEASTITAVHSDDDTDDEDPDDPPHILEKKETKRGRGRGGSSRGSRTYTPRRSRRSSNYVESPVSPSPATPAPPPEPVEKPDANMCLKYTFGVNAWKQWVTTKNADLEKSTKKVKLFKTDILQLTADELNLSLTLFVKEVRKPNGAEYAPDTIYYLCLGIQQYLYENGRIDNIFCDPYYEPFTDCLDDVCKKFTALYNDSQYIVTRVEEEHLWESKQLGAHSPHVLLSTLMFFNTKHFNLVSVEDHLNLSFSHIMKHWRRNPGQVVPGKGPGSRNVLLRFYPPANAFDLSKRKKVYEQQENEQNPLRCPVKLYEFYLSKCPESVKTRNDVFYLLPERSCVPDSPVWYSTMPLGKTALQKMLHRVKMVKEINVALLL